MDENTDSKLKLRDGRVLTLHVFGPLPILLDEDSALITVVGDDGRPRLPWMAEIAALVALHDAEVVRPQTAENLPGDQADRRLAPAGGIIRSCTSAPLRTRILIDAESDEADAGDALPRFLAERVEAALNRAATLVLTAPRVPIARAHAQYMREIDLLAREHGFEPPIVSTRTFSRRVSVIRELFTRIAPERLASSGRTPVTIH